MDFTIDEKFKTLLPEHKESDFADLEAAILRDGVRLPLMIWKEKNILIDGHTRLSICQKHKIPYTVGYKSFASEDHVISWIIQNQMDNEIHRKLTDNQKVYLMGQKYSVEKKITAGAPVGNKHALKEDKNQLSHCGTIENDNTDQEKPSNTAQKIADEIGCGRNTIIRAEQFADAVNTLEALSPEIKTEILTEKVKIPRKIIKELALVAQSEPELAKEQYKEFKMVKKQKKNRQGKQAKKPEVKASVPVKKKPDLMANILHKNMMPEVMDKAYRDFEFELQKERDRGWEKVSKEAVSHFVKKLVAIVES